MGFSALSEEGALSSSSSLLPTGSPSASAAGLLSTCVCEAAKRSSRPLGLGLWVAVSQLSYMIPREADHHRPWKTLSGDDGCSWG